MAGLLSVVEQNRITPGCAKIVKSLTACMYLCRNQRNLQIELQVWGIYREGSPWGILETPRMPPLPEV